MYLKKILNFVQDDRGRAGMIEIFSDIKTFSIFAAEL